MIELLLLVAWLRAIAAGGRRAEFERRQSTETVYRILDRLPGKYRSVLILFELEELSGEEIATLTGLKLATVWVHLHRARARFIAEMKRDSGRNT